MSGAKQYLEILGKNQLFTCIFKFTDLSGLYVTRNKKNLNLSSEEKSLKWDSWEQISTSSVRSRLWGTN